MLEEIKWEDTVKLSDAFSGNAVRLAACQHKPMVVLVHERRLLVYDIE